VPLCDGGGARDHLRRFVVEGGLEVRDGSVVRDGLEVRDGLVVR